jgi:hypothetical protein
MSENASSNGASAPQTGGGPAVPPNLLTGKKLTDFFMDGQPPEQPAQEFAKRPKSVSESEAEQGGDEPINEQQAAVQAETELAGEGGVLEALPEGKGQKDAPFAIADLPEDRFVEIKVDGEKEVVSLRELAAGHIRRRAFNKFTNRAQSAIEEARGYAETAVNERRSVRESLQNFLSDPAKMLDFMLDNQPEVAEQFARGYAAIWDSWQKNPDARRRFEWERQQRKLAVERKKFDEEREQHEKRMSSNRAAQAELERLKPVMQRTMRELGFPKVTPKFRETVNIMCEAARRTNGGKLDPEDLREALHQANKLHPAESPVQARRPAPAPVAQRPAQPGRKPNGQYTKDWNQVPYNRRMADPDFFLRK